MSGKVINGSASSVCRRLILSLLARRECATDNKSIWASVTLVDPRITDDLCYQAIKNLLDKGLLEKIRLGRYMITADGISAADLSQVVAYVYAPPKPPQVRQLPANMTKINVRDVESDFRLSSIGRSFRGRVYSPEKTRPDVCSHTVYQRSYLINKMWKPVGEVRV